MREASSHSVLELAELERTADPFRQRLLEPTRLVQNGFTNAGITTRTRTTGGLFGKPQLLHFFGYHSGAGHRTTCDRAVVFFFVVFRTVFFLPRLSDSFDVALNNVI